MQESALQSTKFGNALLGKVQQDFLHDPTGKGLCSASVKLTWPQNCLLKYLTNSYGTQFYFKEILTTWKLYHLLIIIIIAHMYGACVYVYMYGPLWACGGQRTFWSPLLLSLYRGIQLRSSGLHISVFTYQAILMSFTHFKVLFYFIIVVWIHMNTYVQCMKTDINFKWFWRSI